MTDKKFWKEMMEKDYNELLDYLEHAIQDKQKQPLHPIAKDIYFHMHVYLRITQLAMNLCHAKANVARDAITITTNVIATPEQKVEIESQFEELSLLREDKMLSDIDDIKKAGRT